MSSLTYPGKHSSHFRTFTSFAKREIENLLSGLYRADASDAQKRVHIQEQLTATYGKRLFVAFDQDWFAPLTPSQQLTHASPERVWPGTIGDINVEDGTVEFWHLRLVFPGQPHNRILHYKYQEKAWAAGDTGELPIDQRAIEYIEDRKGDKFSFSIIPLEDIVGTLSRLPTTIRELRAIYADIQSDVSILYKL